jgi:anti-anti-sigma regulatory factor
MEAPHEITITRPADDKLLVRLSGAWKLQHGLPSTDSVLHELDAHPSIRRVAFDASDLAEWDSALLTFLLALFANCRRRDVEM